MPIDHVNVPVADLERSRTFYSAALAPFGYRLVYDGAESLGFGTGDGSDDDEPFALRLSGTPHAGTHIAFTASGTEQVDAFYAAAIAAGGVDNGPPGERPYGGDYYAAFVLDPDGHNIEAVYHGRTNGAETRPARRVRLQSGAPPSGSESRTVSGRVRPRTGPIRPGCSHPPGTPRQASPRTRLHLVLGKKRGNGAPRAASCTATRGGSGR